MLKTTYGKFMTILLVVLLSGLITTGIALADTLFADGDGVIPIVDGNELNFGVVNPGDEVSENVILAIRRQGGPNVTFKNNSTAIVGASVGTLSDSSISSWISTEGGSITLPGDWAGQPNNTLTTGSTFRVMLDIPSNASAGTYTGIITYTASGEANNTTLTRSTVVPFRFSVEIPALSDTTPPVLTLPADIITEATGPSGATVNFVVSAVDDVDGTVPVTVSHASGSTFPLGTTTVNVSATDAASNTASGSFRVTVRDTTAPAITDIEHRTVYATGTLTAVDLTPPTVSDIVTPSSEIIVTNNAPSEGFPVGTTTITWTATDKAGNTASAAQNITVVYNFDGFFRPVETVGVNRVKAGSAVPLKFTLNADLGLNIIKKIGSSTISGKDIVDNLETIIDTITAGQSGLQYDNATGVYTYVWKTDKAFSGFRQLRIEFNDGSIQNLVFNFTK